MQPGNSGKPDHRAVRALFDAALAVAPERRAEFIRMQANGNAALESKVNGLLKAIHGAERGRFLENPAWKAPPPAPPLQQGAMFGAYRVVRRLGGGGMGAVYLVERADDVFHKVAALKVIRPECMSANLVRRFQQERRLLAELDHPNIARIVDGGATSDGLPYFVMDYVEGEHIDKYCGLHRFSVDQKLRLFVQACHAVQYLHEHRIIHRDLKPSNIVVTANGTVKLLDFGIAKALNEPARTKTTRLMTPEYASPEQAIGHNVQPASDVYSLAVLLYELLIGRRPFPAVAATPAARTPLLPSEAAGSNPAHASAENPQQLKRRLEGDLDTILLMALRNEPERRYADAGEFAADLERHLTGRPVFARKDSRMYRARKYIGRNRSRIATVALICVLAIWAIEATLMWMSASRRSARETSDTEKKLLAASANEQRIFSQVGQLQAASGASFALPAPIVEAELADVRGVNEAYADSLARAIRLKPGATPQRARLVEQGARYLDSVGGVSGNDPGVMREVAQGYLTLGDLDGYPGQPNLGDRAGALKMYAKAAAALASLPPDEATRSLLRTVDGHSAAAR